MQVLNTHELGSAHWFGTWIVQLVSQPGAFGAEQTAPMADETTTRLTANAKTSRADLTESCSFNFFIWVTPLVSFDSPPD